MELEQITGYVDSTCQVFNDANESLFTGQIAQYNGTLCVNIVYDPDTCCPYWVLKPASRIYLRLQQDQNSKQFVMVNGMVVNALNDHFFMLPQSITYKDNEREYFRLPIQQPATIVTHNGQPVQHDCTIMDISGGGLCLHSLINYQVGDSVCIANLQLYPDGPTHDLECTILRRNMRSGALQQNIYGCRFLNLEDGDQQRLLSDIFTLQLSKIRTD